MLIITVLSQNKQSAMRSIKSYFFILFAASFIVSCQKEPDASILDVPVTKCTLVKGEFLDGSGGVDDTAGYTYTNSLVSKIAFTDVYYTYQYNANKVSRRSYFQPGTVSALAYDEVTYNGDGTVAKVETFAAAPGVPTGVLLLGYEFTYSAGKLIRMVEKIDTSFTGLPLKAYYEYDYTYTGNNITRYVENDIFNNIKDTVNFTFDNVNNYFKKNPNALFVDIFFNEINGQLAPFLFSANNVTMLSSTGGDLSISYSLDDKTNLKEVLVDGGAVVRYTYKCE